MNSAGVPWWVVAWPSGCYERYGQLLHVIERAGVRSVVWISPLSSVGQVGMLFALMGFSGIGILQSHRCAIDHRNRECKSEDKAQICDPIKEKI
jgi:hypothetical protein